MDYFVVVVVVVNMALAPYLFSLPRARAHKNYEDRVSIVALAAYS